MKKKILSCIIAVCFCLMIPLAFTGCKDGKTVIKINEVTHSVFYAPMYLADSLGYFEEEGFEIELTNGGGADKTMAAVLSGGADIGFAAPKQLYILILAAARTNPKFSVN